MVSHSSSMDWSVAVQVLAKLKIQQEQFQWIGWFLTALQWIGVLLFRFLLS